MKELSRRAILTAVGLGGAAALSGCGLANSSRPAATATATTTAGGQGAADHQGHEAARQRLATVRPVGRALARRQGRAGVKPAPGAG